MSTKKVHVTGANKGIGLAVCQALLEQDSMTYIYLGSRDVGRGEAAIENLKKELGEDTVTCRVELIQIDTGSDPSVQAAASKIKEPLHGIVNNGKSIY